MEFLAEYGLFLAKVVTLVVAIVFLVAALASQSQRGRQHGINSGHIEVRNVNEEYDHFEESMLHAVLPGKLLKSVLQKKKKLQKQQHKQHDEDRPRLYVVSFDGDVKASDVEKLRHEITAILTVARSQDEVLVNVDSTGGMVHTYGLAASQLERLRSANIPLTVCIDKVAASGGYLMACVANRILAAPFAIVGSIGVLAQIPNFNRALKRLDVDYEIMTAGEFKAPVSMFGEITDKGRNKLREELESTHELFKGFIGQYRPQVAIAEVATGEVWYGRQALDKQLIDSVATSDDYLLGQRQEKNIYEVLYVEKKSFGEKLGLAMQQGVSGMLLRLMNHEQSVISRTMQ